MEFHYSHLRARVNHNRDLLESLKQVRARWGVFTGLFGMAANEVYVVTSQPLDTGGLAADTVRHEIWQPTARPTDAAPLSTPGLYVFRRFHVLEENVAEVVALSSGAWQTFETASDYATQPVGLFQPPADPDGIVRMQLVTWYDGFASWETSRAPAAEAAENFRRRHALTLTTYAVATRLVV